MITKGCCERLGLVQRKSDRMIIGVGNTPVQHSSSTVSVTFCPLNNSEEFSVEAVVTGVLTSEIPNFRLKDPNWPTLKSLKLADPEFYIQAPIDMILGEDIYTELMLNGSISLGEGLPMAINTRLGWVLLGKLMGTSESNTEVCNLSLQSEPELEFVMKRFWETESVPSPDLCTQDEDCERLFSNNHGRDSHGRYWVKLPFRQHRPLLGESREKALRRFLSLEGKLCKNVKLYDQYRGFMKEYEHLNHMERVPIAEVKRELCRCYYMPHHPVIREQSTTTKMRVVFDASAKSENNVSLNQFLHKGPKIQQDVFFILLRFRTYPVAITADIEKMYRQIRIHPEDADYQRILWRPSPEEPVVDYRLLTVTYGTTSAPFLAMRTLQQLAEDEGHNYPEASRVTLNDFYVDDLLTGAQTIAEAKELIDQLKDLMKKGGFHLRKWNSNCHEIVSHVEEINEEKKINLEKGAISKILGIVWDHVQDTFRVNITLPEEVVTKRDLLSNIARIFDPLGFLSPTTVALKIIMQELWRSGTGWDEHIPNDIKEKWNNFRAELLKLGELSIPRYVWACEGDRDVQLHGFCDASSVAYSAVCYLRTVSLDGQVHISMLAAKTRVAPSTDTFEMLNKAFPNNAPKRTTVFEWHSRFKAGRISIEDDPRQGRPTFRRTDENVQKITDLIKENPRTTLLELEQDTGISKTTIGRIVTEDLRLKKTPAKFIPRFLTNEQKLCRLATCEDMLEMTRTDPEWKDKIITSDETWVYGYDPETKRQCAEWRGQGEPRPKKSRILKSRNKVLLVAFLDNKGIVHHEYLPAGQTVIKEMYLSILRRLREAIRKKGQKNGLMVTGSYTMTMPALTQRSW
ncbi:hypothetical protein LAZ67_23001282 [Cordylochernes scorpioides]|uniref:Peptidase aspartic putative domain-containing protein n=1 Tax=Cordylochernes scorpioides TaxID=51811 RepID=A0ABY6LT31_9ARAC|nr:hypothetical protein LAZ67_23001282 [Cordylochernes scorpioides]